VAGDRKRSVWVWVATGCGALAAIGICAVGVAVFGLNAIAGSLDAEDVFVSVGEIDCGGARLELVDHEFNINNCEGVSSREVLLRWHEGSATETVYTAIYAFLADGGWGAIDGGPDGPVHVLGERPAGRAEALDVYISPDRFDPPLARRIETCVVDNADALRDLAGRTHAMSQYGAGRPELILVWRRGSRH
jgi:hypothetical protein